MSFDETRHAELQTVLRQKMADNNAIADSFKIEDGVVQVDPEQKSAFDANMATIREVKSLIESMTEFSGIEAWSNTDAADSLAAKAAAAMAGGGGEFHAPSVKTLGQAFIESDEFKSLNGGRNGLTMQQAFEVKTADISSQWGYSVKDVYSALPSGTPANFGPIVREDIVVPPMRVRRVRDLFPVRTTDAAIIEYFRLTGFTNAAATVAERTAGAFTAKPQSSMTFIGEQAPVRTIAHWEAAHRNVLDDVPQLRSIIDNELLYGLRLIEDDQILNGDGTGENLLGILNNTNIQAYSWSSGAVDPVPDTKADAIRRAATLAFLANYEPTGVVVHPSDWEDMELTKNTQGSYLLAVSIGQGADQRIWRMPVIDTPAIAEGTALVGAFGTGCQIYDRQLANIRIAEQHSDFFVRNALVVLAEERLALATKRPESFVKVSFDGVPTA